MATTITPIAYSDTPYSKKFLVNGDGAEGVFPIDDGTPNCFAQALHKGPLRDTLLRALPTALAAFNVTGVRGSEIRIYVVPASTADAAVSPGTPFEIYWKAGATQALAGLSCTAPASGETTYRLVIEIRLNHSTQG
jgi:hypothetical protein